MQQKQRRRAHTTRRWFLGSLGLAAVGLGAASQSSAATDTAFSAESSGEFVVEQGDQCVPVVPLSGDVPIEEYYGWAVEGADFSATGLVDLQRPDTSILFLYDGPNGLSLVAVHDEYGDGTDGGSVTFEFAGLPLAGEWVVQDDYYDDDSNYDQWTRDGGEATVDWTWDESRTDGGVFRGLGTDPDLELRIDPSFNAEATLYGEYYDGEMTDWEVLSESADGPTRISLALDEPIVIRRGTCSTDGTSDDGEDSDDGGHDDDDDDDDYDEDDYDDYEEDDYDDDYDDDDDDHDDDDDYDHDEDDDDYDHDEDDDDDDYDHDEDDDYDHDEDDDDYDHDDYDDDYDHDEDDDDHDDDKDDDHPRKGKGHKHGKGKGKGHKHGKGKSKGHKHGKSKGKGKGKK